MWIVFPTALQELRTPNLVSDCKGGLHALHTMRTHSLLSDAFMGLHALQQTNKKAGAVI